ncbi:SEL1-like repeat protein [Yoonia vestfoldensis]|uniref:SEL1-like repeat protein n=1 Tax=Yoonia vestfoldensis TaxID=245188 RepID=UPI000B3696B8|nr:SEL1-like repeat protein [Yoonia vestfoldensis]
MLLITGTVLAAEGSDASPDPFDAAVDAVKAEEFGLANDLFFALAEQDDHDAQFNLAILLEAGKGTPQNYSLALEWAWLAQLGGVTRAQALADRLAEKLLPATKDMIASRIDSRLQDRLSKGDSAAIMQYVAFNQTILARPDLETAYIWTLIGAALNIAHAATTRNDIEGTLEPRVILAAQDTARMMFLDQDMALLFAETGVASR